MGAENRQLALDMAKTGNIAHPQEKRRKQTYWNILKSRI
jgi:hypothetical protein